MAKPIPRRTPKTPKRNTPTRRTQMRQMRQHPTPRSRPHPQHCTRRHTPPKQPTNTLQNLPQTQNTPRNETRPPTPSKQSQIPHTTTPRNQTTHAPTNPRGLTPPQTAQTAGGHCCSGWRQVWVLFVHAFFVGSQIVRYTRYSPLLSVSRHVSGFYAFGRFACG